MPTVSRSNAAKLLFVVLGLPVIQGCEPMAAAAAYAGMGLMTALNVRPDQRLEFDVEIAILGGETLQFKGDVRCSHRATLEGGKYTIESDTYDLHQNGNRWILSGLSCYPIKLPEFKPSYTVFQVLDDQLAKTYYVSADGGAELKRNVIKWGADYSQKSRKVSIPVFSYGPLIFERLHLKDVPQTLHKAKVPALLSTLKGSDAEPCLLMPNYQQPTVVRVDREELMDLVRPENVYRTEQAFLQYDPLTYGWRIPTNPHLSPPFDASTRYGWDMPGLKAWAACFKVSVADTPITLSKYGAGSQWIYIPAERAIVRVAQMSSGWFSEYKLGKTARMPWF